MRSPTAFGSGSAGNQTRQESSRGHESLSSARASAPTVSRPSPGPAEVLLAVVDVTGERSIAGRPIRYGGYGDVASQRCQRKVRSSSWQQLLSLFSSAGRAHANPPHQRSFSSPREAVRAMADAVKADDTRALLRIFGPGSKDIVLSGDPVEDKEGHLAVH